jgi:hypothetical protein
MLSVGLCFCVSYLTVLNGWNSFFYEDWYVYLDNGAHIHGTIHKSFPSVYLYVYSPVIAKQRL